MRRLVAINALIFAVLASALALAYYGYSYTAEAASRERALIADTLRELAEEKIIGIESPIVEADTKLFASISPERLPELAGIVRTLRAPVASVFVLGPDGKVLPSGYVSSRPNEEGLAFLAFFEREVVPALPLAATPEGQRGHVHQIIGNRPYLFSFMRGRGVGRAYVVVIEADLNHLVASVFPQFFGVTSPRLYQVVDDRGELVYGVPFRDASAVVELPFVETVSQWRLRVTQRDAPAQVARGRRKIIDFVLIGLALAVITAGLVVLLVAVRRERRANELKSEFISNVSHELKTPLSIISMFGEMLASGRVRGPEQATEYADVIWRESVRLARLIDNVLDFAKIERGVNVYEFASGDVGEVVARAVELSTHRLANAHLTATTEIAPDLPSARIDSNALTLAVLNLIDNAIKYAADGQRIEIEVAATAKTITIAVRDHGPGIDPTEHDRIFERFYRARAVRLKPIRGSGIGLALVAHIAHAHGGRVTVTSELGRGATFTLAIPVDDRPDRG
ncbi:MAG: HAMP domain-containing histidine kinase [Kofleriaceae bacterium]|nr:HAMP domain-containing histidine kinase [Kofleriaceae bacterium]MBP9172658.1 HAMP domain-containing histidine kinase [Kofleriaceae bacterium]MBP9862844.1 HAMP domain-containing histidine kinase [Kofleriaceae bacterium]